MFSRGFFFPVTLISVTSCTLWSPSYTSKLNNRMCDFLGTFAKLRKTAINFVMSVCLSIYPSSWNNLAATERFLWILIFEFFRKSVEKIQVSWKSAKNDGYFTWRPIRILYHVSLSYFNNEKSFRHKLQRKSKHTYYVQIFFFSKIASLWNEVEKYCRPGQVIDDKTVSVFLSLQFPFTF